MNRRLLLAAALCLPPSLVAQATTRAEPSNAVARTFLSFGQPYGGWLLQAFDSIPERQYSFRPTPVQRSVAEIAQHLESANYALCSLISGRPHATTAKDALPDSVKARWPKDTLISRVRESLLFCQSAILAITDAQLADTLMDLSPSGPRPVLRVRYPILLVTDLADHYSQLATYMRILGLVPPSALPRKSP